MGHFAKSREWCCTTIIHSLLSWQHFLNRILFKSSSHFTLDIHFKTSGKYYNSAPPLFRSLQRLTGMSQKISVETTHDDIITFEVVKLLTRETRERQFIVEQIIYKRCFVVCVREWMIQIQSNFRGYSLWCCFYFARFAHSTDRGWTLHITV